METNLSQRQENWILAVTIVELLSGTALLVQVIYTWLILRKYGNLIRFMM